MPVLDTLTLVNPECAPVVDGQQVESAPVVVHGTVVGMHGDTGGDFPSTHLRSDVVLEVEPDEADDDLAADGNEDGGREIAFEWEVGKLPDWAWPAAGDPSAARAGDHPPRPRRGAVAEARCGGGAGHAGGRLRRPGLRSRRRGRRGGARDPERGRAGRPLLAHGRPRVRRPRRLPVRRDLRDDRRRVPRALHDRAGVLKRAAGGPAVVHETIVDRVAYRVVADVSGRRHETTGFLQPGEFRYVVLELDVPRQRTADDDGADARAARSAET